MKTNLISFFLLLVFYSSSQNGSFDFTYNQTIFEEVIDGSGPSGSSTTNVFRVVEQPDGKLLVAGEFGIFNQESPHVGILRIFSNGQIDTTFHDVTMNYAASCMVMQPDGKIILGGYFTLVNGQAYSKIVRFESNGLIDTSFNIGSGINGFVNELFLDNNGKLVVLGNIIDYNGIPQSDIIRLNLDGSIDTSFNVGLGPDLGALTCIEQMLDGSYFVGGSFTSFNGITSPCIAHINSFGDPITSFNSGIAQFQAVNRIKKDSNSNLFIAGSYFDYNNVPVGNLFSIDTVGNLNPGFSNPSGHGEITDFVFSSSSRIIAVGGFSVSYGGLGNHIVCYEQDGSLSSLVNFNEGLDDDASSVMQTVSGKIIVGGYFEFVNGAYRPKLARFESNGDYDPSLLPIPGPNAAVYKILSLNNNKSIVAGDFSFYNGTKCNGLVKLNSDGLIDSTFDFQMPHVLGVQDVIKTPTGGFFLICVLSTTGDTIVRIDENGMLDGSFVESMDGYNDYDKMILQPNGKLLVSGYINIGFNDYNGGIIRLNSDGSREPNFFITYSNSASVKTFDLYPNGKIIVSGHNTSLGTVWGTYVNRYNANGSSDLSFHYVYMVSGVIKDLKVLPSGKTLLLGGFNNYDSYNSYGMVRIDYNGLVDSTFYVANSVNINNIGSTLKIVENGEILVAGANVYIIRLFPNGSVNPNFQIHPINSFILGSINSIAVQSDGKILLGGYFKGQYDVNYRLNMIRINSDVQDFSDLRVGFSVLEDRINCPVSAYCTAYASFGTPPYEYEWVNSIPMNNSPSQVFTIGGDYNLKVTDAIGDTVTITLHIYGPSTPCGLEQVELDELDCQVYPNPCIAGFEIRLNAEKEILFELFTTYGKKILEGGISEDITQVNMSETPSGAYFLKLKNKENQIYKVQKIIKL